MSTNWNIIQFGRMPAMKSSTLRWRLLMSSLDRRKKSCHLKRWIDHLNRFFFSRFIVVRPRAFVWKLIASAVSLPLKMPFWRNSQIQKTQLIYMSVFWSCILYFCLCVFYAFTSTPFVRILFVFLCIKSWTISRNIMEVTITISKLHEICHNILL